MPQNANLNVCLLAPNVWANNAGAFGANTRILSRQKQWSDNNNPFQKMERRCLPCYVKLPERDRTPIAFPMRAAAIVVWLGATPFFDRTFSCAILADDRTKRF